MAECQREVEKSMSRILVRIIKLGLLAFKDSHLEQLIMTDSMKMRGTKTNETNFIDTSFFPLIFVFY